MFNKRVRIREIRGSYNQPRYDALLVMTAIVSMRSFEQLIFSCNKLKYLCMKRRLKIQMLTAALRVRLVPQAVFSFCRFKISSLSSLPLFFFFLPPPSLSHFLYYVFFLCLNYISAVLVYIPLKIYKRR